MIADRPHVVYTRPVTFPFLFVSDSTIHGNVGEPIPYFFGSSLFNRLRADGATIIIPAFSVEKFNQVFVSHGCIRIDTDVLPSALYRITVVHHFQVEDTNPNLDQCIAGIFLSPRTQGEFARAEDLQTECRSLFHLGYLDNIEKVVVPYDYQNHETQI